MTVAELREALAAFDGELTVVIHDADTDWALRLQTVLVRGEYVALRGDYDQRVEDLGYLDTIWEADESEPVTPLPCNAELRAMMKDGWEWRKCELLRGHGGEHRYPGIGSTDDADRIGSNRDDEPT